MDAKDSQVHVAGLFVIALHHTQEPERNWGHGHQRPNSNGKILGRADFDRPARSSLAEVRRRDFGCERLVPLTEEPRIPNSSETNL